ncbi:unnamed protein product [Cyprideis torosa]|uniref:Aminotransferase class I/classII large domain-containing protein n=1 Tax=Cyprideis torosa TaxID=163714 RepID=A0A7R8WE42_9CRUS|nr:unnamed protein product [Cyprideis torosa]CAG0895313.1 unnamed protein product [Cyprideis torosa]
MFQQFNDVLLTRSGCLTSPLLKYSMTNFIRRFQLLEPGKIDLEETLASCKSPTRLLILTNPGNPSGTAYNEEDLQPLVDLYPEGTILGGGMSKWGASGGFRLGYVHFPPQLGVLRRAVLMASSQTHTSPACPIQHAYAEVLNSDEGRREIANFIEGSRLILEAVARYVERELTSVGVKCVPSDAGFYAMPDFANIREGLNMRGITTGIDMTSAMLHEAGVGLLPGEAFLRPSSELTTRLCFINFDGGPFLASILDRLPGATITDEDIRRFCPKTVQGIEAIKAFIMKHQMPER